MHRMMGITYKTVWFLNHRIREAMASSPKTSGPIGRKDMIVEVRETSSISVAFVWRNP